MRCQCVFRELREAHDRTTARWPTAPWMLARAFAKRMCDARSVFNARTQSLGPSRNSAQGALCYAFRSPSMPTDRSRCQRNTQNNPSKCARVQSAGTKGRARYGTHETKAPMLTSQPPSRIDLCYLLHFSILEEHFKPHSTSHKVRGRFTPIVLKRASQVFPRVARSCTLLRTGTSPCSVSVRSCAKALKGRLDYSRG